MDAAAWNERYRSATAVWSTGPNELFAELATALPAGLALDLGAGEGRTALWLAQRGWQVTAVDFAADGLAKGRSRAEGQALRVHWVLADVTTWPVPQAGYDLIAVLYLHLPPVALTRVLRGAAAGLAPGGTLLVLGHDRENLTRGVGGPQNANLLYTPSLLLSTATSLTVDRCEQVTRHSDAGDAVDTLLLARRPEQR